MLKSETCQNQVYEDKIDAKTFLTKLAALKNPDVYELIDEGKISKHYIIVLLCKKKYKIKVLQ